VQTLPHRHRGDFADLADVSEFVIAATIPDGTYVRAVIRMDDTDAAVSVEVDGSPTPAEVVDARMVIEAWRREYNQETEEVTGRADARWERKTTGHEADCRNTLNHSATESGGTSATV